MKKLLRTKEKFLKTIRIFRDTISSIFIFLIKFILYPCQVYRRRRFLRSKAGASNVLIMYMGEGLGDCIVFSGALAAVRNRFRDAKISLLIFDRFTEYFKGNPHVDRIFGYPDYRYTKNGFMKFLAYSRVVKKDCDYDIIIDLLPNRFIKPSIFTWLIHAKLVIGFDHSIKTLFYDICVKINWNKYIYDVFFDLLIHLGIKRQEASYWFPAQVDKEPLHIKKELSDKTVVLAPGGKFNLLKSKDYRGFQYYPELVAKLAKTGIRVILVGAEYDSDPKFASENLVSENVVNLLGKTTLMQLFSIVKDCANLVVCNTSGLLYVGLAAGVPAVFYAHPLENVSRWKPFSNNAVYYSLQDKVDNKVTIEDFFDAIAKHLQ